MKDIKRTCYTEKIPGIRELYFVDIEEISQITITGKSTVNVALKPDAQWGLIDGKNTVVEAEYGKYNVNRITTTINGWNLENGSIEHLTRKRFVCKFTDKAGEQWLLGYGEPLHLSITQTAPDSAQQYQSLQLEFSNESEFGLLTLNN